MKTKYFCLFLLLTLLSDNHAISQDTFTNSIGMKFVYIKAGTFIMGSPLKEAQRILEDYPHEKQIDEREHKVTLTDGYYIQTTEVTQRQWKEVMDSNPSFFIGCGDNCPVENVSWIDAQSFIQKLNARENTNEYMLTTEAQWEFACRAGSRTSYTNGKMIGLDNDLNLDVVAWYLGNSDKTVHPVATKKSNRWGLYDMHGNVLEWVANSKYRYPSYQVKNPPIVYLDSGSKRVYRGGSWGDPPYACRSAYRKEAEKSYRHKNLGLRLIKRGGSR
ncbi:MAG: formylglycine-generating enzyme family protein [Deltaproteobacteria bacterium]|nr:formylglycine-generating enzyme family protein [Deltaproteobacteria bacterium]